MPSHYLTTFAAAGTVTLAADTIAAVLAMPAVDGSNQDTLLANAGTASVWLAFGPGAVAGPTVPGCIQIAPGERVLLTGTAATLAAMTCNPDVMGGAPATAAAGASVCTVVGSQRTGGVTITRGTASAVPAFLA